MTTLTETQAGGGQPGAQVAASNWKKVLKFGDNQWPPEPPHGQVPGWVTIPDPTLPRPRVSRFVPKQPPGPPPGYKAPPQPYPISTAEGKTYDFSTTTESYCIGITIIKFRQTTTTGRAQTCSKANAIQTRRA